MSHILRTWFRSQVSSRKWNNLHSALKYWRPKKYSEEPHVKFWPFTLKIFSLLLDMIKLFCKQRKIIKIKFWSIWCILKAITASRNLNMYKTMFYLEKLRQRALLLISEYSSFGFYFCFSLTFSKLKTCALTWCCPVQNCLYLNTFWTHKTMFKHFWTSFELIWTHLNNV